MERRNLPWDLIEEIFSRVPAKSVARFRSASKGWNALSKSGRFAKKHSANAPKEESLSIMLIDSRVCLVKINLHGFHNNAAPSAKVAYEFNLQDPLSNSSQVDICNVFHCDGLLLCSTRDKRLVVWNPCSGDTKWIKPRDSYTDSDYYALGYDNRSSSCKRYKILRNYQSFYPQMHTGCEIYDSASDSWRVLGVNTDWCLGSQHGAGVSMKGNAYWVALDTTTQEEEGTYTEFFLSFDFSTERFQSLSLPDPFPYMISALSVVRDERLCLLGTEAYSKALDVWVMTTTSPGSVMSWSKLLTVKANHEVKINGLSFLADEQNRAVMYCQYYSDHNKILHIVGRNKHIQVDPRDRRKSTVRPSSSCTLLLNYVPSLAQIRQGTLVGRRKRKEQSM